MAISKRGGLRLVPIVACAAALVPAAAAQASDASLRGVLRSSVPKIVKSQNKINSALAAYEKKHDAAPVVSAIKSQDKTLVALEGRISSQAPSTANGAKAKSEILRGLGLIVSSNKALAKDFQKTANGKSVSTKQVLAAAKADKKGNQELNAGAKLLKV